MASSTPIASTSSLSKSTVVKKRYGAIRPQLSVPLSKRSPKLHARYTGSDLLNIAEGKAFLEVKNDFDLLGDWQYGSRRTRSYTRLEQARRRRAVRMFRTPEPAYPPSPSTGTAAPFTAYFNDRNESIRSASGPDNEQPTASPCELTRCKQRRRLSQQPPLGKRLDFTGPRPAVRLRLTQPRPPIRIRFTHPRPPCRLHLTMPRQPLKLFFPANVVDRNRAERMAQAALQRLSKQEVQATH